jgi:hypothetical protein
MYMRYFLNRPVTIAGYFMRSAHFVRLMILVFVSLLVSSFNRMNTHAGPVHEYDVAGYTSKDTVRPASGGLPGNVSNDEFKKKALAKIKAFQGCLFILCDITSGNAALDNAVDQATSLFVDGAIIEVSSLHSDEKKHLKVRDFLEKFRNLHYDRVVITFSHVDYVSNIRKGSDGKYYGLVSFEQTFRGYNDGRLVYEDETKKTTEVQLVVYERNLRGNAIQQWDVMLSDVEILGTKRPKA